MKVKRGVIYGSPDVFKKDIGARDCLIFENGVVATGDTVALWYANDTMIIGKVCGIGVGCCSVAFGTEPKMNIWIVLDYIKGCAKKIDGKWVSMREVKDES